MRRPKEKISPKITKEHVESLIEIKIDELREEVERRLAVIASMADEYGIIVRFTGLPPFDEFGNSGYYFPVQENGVPWYGSDTRNKYYPIEGSGAPEGWLSSDIGC